ncbi:hypothetical protein [Mycobacterium sp.]|uniref:hypothetical protein n=1 Tax=Mycobacterium sp. TaxID=1785 RepID=UPI00333F9A3E
MLESLGQSTRPANITRSAPDDLHAGELDTSVLLAAYPDYVATAGTPPTTAHSIVAT